MKNRRRPGLLFDLDGTLLDTPKAISFALAEAIREETGAFTKPQQVQPLIGLPLEEMIKTLISEPSEKAVNAIMHRYTVAFKEEIVPSASELLFDTVPQTLKTLSDEGWTMGVVTSKFHKSALMIMQSASIDKFFDVIVGADCTERGKPDPQPAIMAMSHLQTTADETFVIGDAVADMQMAIAAGCKAIGVSFGVGNRHDLYAHGARSVVSRFGDLIFAVRTDETGVVL